MEDESPPTWEKVAAERKQKQLDSIPKEWLITTSVTDDRANVMDVPLTCGLLTERDLEITEVADVDYILQKLASAEWSSVEVTTAYYKRAIIAQQLVSDCISMTPVSRP
jgi:amidase